MRCTELDASGRRCRWTGRPDQLADHQHDFDEPAGVRSQPAPSARKRPYSSSSSSSSSPIWWWRPSTESTRTPSPWCVQHQHRRRHYIVHHDRGLNPRTCPCGLRTNPSPLSLARVYLAHLYTRFCDSVLIFMRLTRGENAYLYRRVKRCWKRYLLVQWKKRSERRKHCALALVRRSLKISPHRRPPSRGRRMAKI